MDSYLNILSLALAIGAFVPLVSRSKGRHSRLSVIGISSASLLILIGCYQAYQYDGNQADVRRAKAGMIASLKATPSGLTFDDLMSRSYYESNDVANAAIDALVDSGQVIQAPTEAKDELGNVYRIRRYRLSLPYNGAQ